jgi:hypothetical protein
MPEPVGAAAALLSAFKDIINDVYAGVKATAQRAMPVVLNDAQMGFRSLILESYERRSKIKTIIDPHVTLNLKDVYVPSNLVHAGKVICESDFIDTLVTKRRAVITGTAGAGKSLFLRALMLHIMDCWPGPIPIFVELRSVNDLPPQPDALEDLILRAITAHVRDFSVERLQQALFSGRFMLILDALDEVEQSRKANISKEIVRLAERNQKAIIVISSRPDDVFQAWEEFDVYKMQGLSQALCAELVKKLSYPQINDIKEKFLTEIVSRSYGKHREFLSVPLLLVMMLLVYRNFVEVPDKIIIFYKRAFETLFYGHDAMKGETGLKRPTRSNLAYEDFLRTFSAFCAAGYSSGKITFEPNVAESLAAKAISLADVNCTATEFVADLQEAVCVLQRDGTELSFVHRSFQEYFAAAYFVRVDWPLERRTDFMMKSGYRMAGNISGMMRELDPTAFERNWLLTAIDIVIGNIEQAISDNPGFSPETVIASELIEMAYREHQAEASWMMSMHHSQNGFLWDFGAKWGKTYGVSGLEPIFPDLLDDVWADEERLKPFIKAKRKEDAVTTYELRPTLTTQYELLLANSAVGKALKQNFERMKQLRDAVRSSLKERARREVDLFS